MKPCSIQKVLLGALMVLLAGPVMADEDIPLQNWTVPQYSLSGLGKAVDATSPRAFIGLPPCRIADTRGGAPITGGMFTGGSDVRTWTIEGLCGVPAGADAVSLNWTVTGPTAIGFLTAWPAGGAVPASSILNFAAGQQIANAAILPLGAGGAITVNVSAPTHVILDVNGYFSDTLGTPGNFFTISNSSFFYSIFTNNASTTCPGACGIVGNIDSTAGGWAVVGLANGATGLNYGVYGRALSTSSDVAGVKGVDDSGSPAGNTGFRSAGVRGESLDDIGVHGIVGPNGLGVVGRLNDAGGSFLAQGFLGFATGGTNYGVYAQSNYGGSGAKFFVEPHSEKADMVIRYVALEGPESGTYFRGRGKFERGVATIEVPESFRLVSDSEGLSVQVTPIGDMASVAVVSIGLDKIVVKGSRNVEFFYTVNGVRRSHKHLTPIGPGSEFMPEAADARMPTYLTDVQKQMLISNGTYREDGTVNMETAKSLGWDKTWEERKKGRLQDTSPLEMKNK